MNARLMPSKEDVEMLFEIARKKFGPDHNVLQNMSAVVVNLPIEKVLHFIDISPASGHELWRSYERKREMMMRSRNYYSFLDYAKDVLSEEPIP